MLSFLCSVRERLRHDVFVLILLSYVKISFRFQGILHQIVRLLWCAQFRYACVVLLFFLSFFLSTLLYHFTVVVVIFVVKRQTENSKNLISPVLLCAHLQCFVCCCCCFSLFVLFPGIFVCFLLLLPFAQVSCGEKVQKVPCSKDLCHFQGSTDRNVSFKVWRFINYSIRCFERCVCLSVCFLQWKSWTDFFSLSLILSLLDNILAIKSSTRI